MPQMSLRSRIMRTVTLSAAAILVIGSATLSTAEPAMAAGGRAVLINANTGLCVDDSAAEGL